MAEEENNKGKQPLWYLRRRGQVKGPFPSGSIRRFVLVGRVLLKDEVSSDQTNWQPVSDVAEVLPPEVRKAIADGSVDDLIKARMREDERTGHERRVREKEAEFRKERRGERRRIEEEIETHHRKAKTDLLEATEQKERPLVSMIVSGVLTLAVIVGGFILYLQAPDAQPDPDCSAAPAPGVNWRNCRLDGVEAKGAELDGALFNNAVLRSAKLAGSNINNSDLQYADFTGADLSYTGLKAAAMKGVNLRNADLSYADLSGADLSFADLRGANLGSAILEKATLDSAIWIDGKNCLPGSVGGCRLK